MLFALREIAVFEIMGGEVPPAVAVNEAIRTCQKFDTDTSAKLINGVLGGYVRSKMSADKALAFDTSNYTTSAATLTVSGEAFNSKNLLPSKAAKRGLRQSDAVFAHTKQLYDVFKASSSGIEAGDVNAPAQR